jgi:hypothetical protein
MVSQREFERPGRDARFLPHEPLVVFYRSPQGAPMAVFASFG